MRITALIAASAAALALAAVPQSALTGAPFSVDDDRAGQHKPRRFKRSQRKAGS